MTRMRQEGSLARAHEEPGLPRGRASLPQAAVRGAQRDRLLRAVIAASAQHGYLRVRITDIVARARVSRAAFYNHFTDKDDCLLAATLHGRALQIDRMTAAVRDLPAAASPDERLRASCRAFLEFLHDEPEFTRVFYLELPGAGPRAIARLAEAHQKFARLNEVWHERARERDPSIPMVGRAAFLATAGAATELVRAAVHAGSPALPELEDTLVNLHRALLLGIPWPPDGPLTQQPSARQAPERGKT